MSIFGWLNNPVAVDISVAIILALAVFSFVAVRRHGRQGLLLAGLGIFAVGSIGLLWSGLYGMAFALPMQLWFPCILGGLLCTTAASAGISITTARVTEA